MADMTESSTRIDASPEAVLDVIADLESYPEWTGGMTAVTVLSTDEGGWADQAEFSVDAGPIKDTYVLDYTWDVEEDSTGTVSWKLVRANSLTAMDGAYVLAADGDGTQVTYRLSAETKLPMPGMLRRKAERSIVDAALSGLKKRVEAGQ